MLVGGSSTVESRMTGAKCELMTGPAALNNPTVVDAVDDGP